MKFLINPNRFIKFSELVFKPLIYLSVIFLIIGIVFTFFLSPNDYQQGATVRIMYIHVPAAWIAILFLLYLIITFLKNSITNINVSEKITAVLIIVGSINLPIIKFSVDWWNTLHQPASISKLSSPSIDPSMLRPLVIMTIALMLLAIVIGIIRIKAEILKRKLR